MATSAISSTSQTALGDQLQSVKPKEPMGKDEFLKLLTTQLQYQDPLDPMDNTEFVTQLAQFSELESMQAIQSTVKDNNMLLESINSAYATSMIGREIRANGNNVYLNGTGGANLDYVLSGDASGVQIDVYDERGNNVKSANIGKQSSGLHTYIWDGKDNNGNALPSGRYAFRITAADDKGNTIGASTYTAGTIDGVVYEGGVPYLTIGTDKIALSDVIKVSNTKK